MSLTNTNGRVRKSLAEQIDRLDRVLDGLAEGLNEAVAQAVREAVGIAVKEAVQAVLTEVLANPEVLEKLRGVASPAAALPAAEPSQSRLGELLTGCWNWIGARVQAVRQVISNGLEWSGQIFAACCRLARICSAAALSRIRALRCVALQLLTAIGVGVAVGTATYFAGPWLAVAVSAMGGFAMTLAVHAGIWLRRTFGTSAVLNA
jgi:hypothetical protein